MARSKSPSGSKASRSNTNKEQTGVNPSAVPDVKTVAGGSVPAEVSPQAGITSQAEVIPRAQAKPEPKKLEVVKSDSRKNLVPINVDDEIRRRAYELYQQRGTGSGSEAEDWLTAEREIRQRYRQQSA